jgi:hypothetical protein
VKVGEVFNGEEEAEGRRTQTRPPKNATRERKEEGEVSSINILYKTTGEKREGRGERQ